MIPPAGDLRQLQGQIAEVVKQMRNYDDGSEALRPIRQWAKTLASWLPPQER